MGLKVDVAPAGVGLCLCPLVALLLARRSPPHLARPVVAGVVLAVQRPDGHPAWSPAFRPRSDLALDVLDEQTHVMPPFADLDAAPAVQVVVARPGVLAAAQHLVPDFVERVRGQAVNSVVRPHFRSADQFPLQAAAGSITATCQVRYGDRDLCSAITHAVSRAAPRWLALGHPYTGI